MSQFLTAKKSLVLQISATVNIVFVSAICLIDSSKFSTGVVQSDCIFFSAFSFHVFCLKEMSHSVVPGAQYQLLKTNK